MLLEMGELIYPFTASILALVFAVILIASVLRKEKGSQKRELQILRKSVLAIMKKNALQKLIDVLDVILEMKRMK